MGPIGDLANLPPLPDSDGGGLFAVTCVTSSDCWAVGAVLGPAGNGSPTGTLTEHWDGAAWSMVPSPTPSGAAGGILQSVSCASSSDCWAVGYGTDQNGGALQFGAGALGRFGLGHCVEPRHGSDLRSARRDHLPE